MASNKIRSCLVFYCIHERSSWKAEISQDYFWEFLPCSKRNKHLPSWVTFCQTVILIPLPKRHTNTHTHTLLLIRICTWIPNPGLDPSQDHTWDPCSRDHSLSSVFSLTLTCIVTSSRVVTNALQIYLTYSLIRKIWLTNLGPMQVGDTSNSSRVCFLKFLGTWTSKLMINEIQKPHWKSIRRGWLGNSEIQLIYYHLAKCAFGALSITYLSRFLQHMYTYWFGCLSREVTFQQY